MPHFSPHTTRGYIVAYMASRFPEYGDESARRPRRQEQDDLSDNEGWDEDEETDIDREWYLQDDEGGVAGDADHNPFAQYEDMHGQVSNVLARRQQRMTARQAQYNVDLDAWEKSRLQSGGVGGRQAVRDDLDDHDENRIHPVSYTHLTLPTKA